MPGSPVSNYAPVEKNAAGFKSMAAWGAEQLAMYGGTAVRVQSPWSGTWAARLSSPGPVPLGPASALLSIGFALLSILLVLVGVRPVEMSRQVCHIKVTPDATSCQVKLWQHTVDLQVIAPL